MIYRVKLSSLKDGNVHLSQNIVTWNLLSLVSATDSVLGKSTLYYVLTSQTISTPITKLAMRHRKGKTPGKTPTA